MFSRIFGPTMSEPPVGSRSVLVTTHIIPGCPFPVTTYETFGDDATNQLVAAQMAARGRRVGTLVRF